MHRWKFPNECWTVANGRWKIAAHRWKIRKIRWKQAVDRWKHTAAGWTALVRLPASEKRQNTPNFYNGISIAVTRGGRRIALNYERHALQ